MKSELRKFMDANGSLPLDVLLGHITWFTVADGDYVHDDIEKWFVDLGLDPTFVPLQSKAIDAFRRATSEADNTSYPLKDGTTATVLVRDVTKDSKIVLRHLVREIRDSSKRKLAFNRIGEATFYRPSTRNGKVDPGSERVRFTLDQAALMPDEKAMALGVVEEMNERYERYNAYVDGMKVRGMLRNYLLHLNAIQIKPSVYFVHITRAQELAKLEELAKRLGGVEPETSLHTLPLPDLESQREMVINAFQTEAVESLTGLVKEIADLRDTRKKITPDAYAKLKGKFDDVMSRATEYTRKLGVSQDSTAAAAEVALETLFALQQRMIGDAS